jgi:hypothetical protein
VTNFEFISPAESFGSIIPLPGRPSRVERGGDWTLQRLVREVTPERAPFAREAVAAASASGVTVEQQVRVDALDVTILRGAGRAVARWANKQGFALPADTPRALEYYSRRSPYFMAAKYDATAAVARGLRAGDGIPVHLTIPVDRPWVPLHILAVAKPAQEVVNAAVFLLTDTKPDVLAGPGVASVQSTSASSTLLTDLRSDRGMQWVPNQMWLTYLTVNEPVAGLGYDLAVGVNGHRARLGDTGATRWSQLRRPTPGAPRAATDAESVSWPEGIAVGAVTLVAALIVVAAWRRRSTAVA